ARGAPRLRGPGGEHGQPVRAHAAVRRTAGAARALQRPGAEACDQFLHQEPGTEAEISEFCQVNYGVTFPMHAKVEVNGEGTHPLFRWLTGAHGEGIPGGDVEWNFAKFLLGPDGTVRRRYAPATEPADLADDIEALLAERG